MAIQINNMGNNRDSIYRVALNCAHYSADMVLAIKFVCTLFKFADNDYDHR